MTCIIIIIKSIHAFEDRSTLFKTQKGSDKDQTCTIWLLHSWKQIKLSFPSSFDRLWVLIIPAQLDFVFFFSLFRNLLPTIYNNFFCSEWFHEVLKRDDGVVFLNLVTFILHTWASKKKYIYTPIKKLDF